MADVDLAFGPTPEGQLLYDLAFTPMRADYLARKHGITEAEVLRLRDLAPVKKLIRQNTQDGIGGFDESMKQTKRKRS